MHVQKVMDKHRDGNQLGNNAVEMKGKLYSVNLIQSGLDFLYNTERPRFSGPNHGPTHAFEVDISPTIFFDKLFSGEV